MYKPEFPHKINKQISKYTNTKLPAFFEYAKDKEKSQVEKRNDSLVNKIYSKIPNKPIKMKGLKFGEIDYQIMMSNPKIRCSNEVSNLYDKLNKQYRYMINMKDEYTNNLQYIACIIKNEFSKFGYSNETIADMLVEYLYGKEKRYKQLLWFCYGQYVVNNIEKNLRDKGEYKSTKDVQCVDCNEWFEVNILNTKSCRCSKCQHEETKRIKREYKHKKSKR